MAQDDPTLDDFTDAGSRGKREDIVQIVPAEAAVTPGSGITGSDYGAAGGVSETQAVASDFTGNINGEPGTDASGLPETGEQS